MILISETRFYLSPCDRMLLWQLVGVEEILPSFMLSIRVRLIRDPFKLTVPFGVIGKW
jgi:hypothetical protein